MTFSHTTFSQAKALLANRLGDSSKVYWLDSELGLYLKEALSDWSQLTSYWRERVDINTIANQIFYDLSTVPELSRTTTDQALIETIQYHLKETISPTSWITTDQFSSTDVVGALQRRRDQFLLETGIVRQNTTSSLTPPVSGRVPIAETILDVVRAAWIDSSGTYNMLWREDEISAASFTPRWQLSAGTPTAYSMGTTPPLYLQLIPPADTEGTLELVTVSSGTTLDPATGVVMGVPDDFCSIIKWGAMADMLGRDGPGSDPLRAQYCKDVWEQGIQTSLNNESVLAAEKDGVVMMIDALFDLDSVKPGWQNDTASTPQRVVMAGHNLLALWPKPDTIYTITLDVVRKTPLPLSDGEYIQIGREYLDIILDYAQHLATFKDAGAEFQATYPLRDNFMRAASLFNAKLDALNKDNDALYEGSRRQDTLIPRRIYGETVQNKSVSGGQ